MTRFETTRIPILDGVHMVATAHEAHPEPPLDTTATTDEQLAWLAALVMSETTLTISLTRTQRGTYCISVQGPGGSSGLSDRPFASAWKCLSSIEIGARMATPRNPTS